MLRDANLQETHLLIFYQVLTQIVDTLSYKTKSLRKEDVKRQWVVIDAAGQRVGRLASRITHRLRGKHLPSYTPHIDCGDAVIVINAEKVRFTGRKMTQKLYFRHTGYPGGGRYATPQEMLRKKPTFVLENAVKGMLPHTRLGAEMFRHFFVYAGSQHPHSAQKPIALDPTKI